MGKSTDVTITGVDYFLLPVETRVPLKFGTETLTSVTCVRVRTEVRRTDGTTAAGWGETPLSVQWVWPSASAYEARFAALLEFTAIIARSFADFSEGGHPLEISHDFQETVLHDELGNFNRDRDGEAMPWLAALVAFSAFDIALHDAYGIAHDSPVYDTYNASFMNRDLAAFLAPAPDAGVSFHGVFPDQFLVREVPSTL
ncbi:MAG: hypothetical protein HKO57_03370, partial [Akkermansiaceae bacterium]|nr:hypothetical protein [Akkermansiaceae bacterium]